MGAELGDLHPDEPRVEFELLFALALGAVRAAAAEAALAAEVRPFALQARQRVVGLRQLNLQARLVGAGMDGEDAEDDLLAVDDGESGERLPVALLGGREEVVEDDDVGAGLLGEACELLGLAFAELGALSLYA